MYTTLNIQWDFDLENPNDKEAHDQFAAENGVPTTINVYDYFDDPSSITNEQLTDALSDEHGWLIYGMQSTEDSPHTDDESCNSDQNNIIINHQDQSINSKENNMETNNTTTPNTNEDSMITQLFQQFIENGGTPKVTEFKKHLNELINSDIKQLCGRSGKSADGTDWRSLFKARFSGRGAKWVQVALQEINPTISEFQSQGIDCSKYITFIEANGAAWIRFAGPRINPEGQQSAAFEVRTEGSTVDHPKQLHFIPVSLLDETIRPLGGTPHSLKLEVIAKPEDVIDPPVDLGAMCDEIVEEMTEEAAEPQTPETEIPSPETLEEVFEDFIDDANDDAFAEA